MQQPFHDIWQQHIQGSSPGEEFVAAMGRALEEAKAAMRTAQDRQSRYANKGEERRGAPAW